MKFGKIRILPNKSVKMVRIKAALDEYSVNPMNRFLRGECWHGSN